MQAPGHAQVEGGCGDGFSEDEAPRAWEPNDGFCRADEPVWDEEHEAAGPVPNENIPGPMSPYPNWMSSSDTQFSGVQTISTPVRNVQAAMNVVDPGIAHPSDHYLTQHVLVADCSGNRWFEAGWAEFGWSELYTEQYPYVRMSHGGWGFFVSGIAPSPGERIWLMLKPTGTTPTMWGAFLNSNRTNGWLLLHEFDLGTNVACEAEATVQSDAGIRQEVPFAPIRFGSGSATGVMLDRDFSSPDVESWDTSVPTQEIYPLKRGYGITWTNKYYDWVVRSTYGSPPTAALSVQPPTGDLTTTFVADTSGSHDPHGWPITFFIDWGDGRTSSSTATTQAHQYQKPGWYRVGLHALSEDGEFADETAWIQVCSIGEDCDDSNPVSPFGLDHANATADELGRGLLGPTYDQVLFAVVAAREQLGIEEVSRDQMDLVEQEADRILFDQLNAQTEAHRELIATTVTNTLNMLGDDSYDFNAEEAGVCVSNTLYCRRALEAKNDAIEWTKRAAYFGNLDYVNTKRDAVRHCLWNALMTKRTTRNYAERMATAHEENPNSPAGQMDLYNNREGRLIGVLSEGAGEGIRGAANRCRDYANAGLLITSTDDDRIQR